MKQFFLQIYTNLPCSSRTIQSQFPFKYDICVFIAYALFQANSIISTNSVDFATNNNNNNKQQQQILLKIGK